MFVASVPKCFTNVPAYLASTLTNKEHFIAMTSVDALKHNFVHHWCYGQISWCVCSKCAQMFSNVPAYLASTLTNKEHFIAMTSVNALKHNFVHHWCYR